MNATLLYFGECIGDKRIEICDTRLVVAADAPAGARACVSEMNAEFDTVEDERSE